MRGPAQSDMSISSELRPNLGLPGKQACDNPAWGDNWLGAAHLCIQVLQSVTENHPSPRKVSPFPATCTVLSVPTDCLSIGG